MMDNENSKTHSSYPWSSSATNIQHWISFISLASYFSKLTLLTGKQEAWRKPAEPNMTFSKHIQKLLARVCQWELRSKLGHQSKSFRLLRTWCSQCVPAPQTHSAACSFTFNKPEHCNTSLYSFVMKVKTELVDLSLRLLRGRSLWQSVPKPHFKLSNLDLDSLNTERMTPKPFDLNSALFDTHQKPHLGVLVTH